MTFFLSLHMAHALSSSGKRGAGAAGAGLSSSGGAGGGLLSSSPPFRINDGLRRHLEECLSPVFVDATRAVVDTLEAMAPVGDDGNRFCHVRGEQLVVAARREEVGGVDRLRQTVSSTDSLTDFFAELDANSTASRALFDTIAAHHEGLRGVGWEAAKTDSVALEKYAVAAAAVGEKRWAKMGIDWCVEMSRRFIIGTGGERCKLLDVGSCGTLFDGYDGIDALAVDLQPEQANDRVLQCDFLAVDVGVGDAIVVREGSLKSLPGGSFDVVVLSLVLSYLPLPRQRALMIEKARTVLREGGLLLIVDTYKIEKRARIGHSKNDNNLKNWVDTIERIGFSRRLTHHMPRTLGLAFIADRQQGEGEAELRLRDEELERLRLRTAAPE